MKEYAAGIRSSDLSLVEVPTKSGDAAPSTDAESPAGTEPVRASAAAGAERPGTDSERASAAASAERYLAKAKKEHAAGHVDPPLWARAVAQAGADEALATRIYLESRATALRVEKRQERAARRAAVVEVLSNAPEPGFAAEAPKAPDEKTSKKASQTRRGSASANRWRVMVAAGTVACVAIASGSIALLSETDAAQQHNVAKPAPPVKVSASGVANTGKPAREEVSSEDFVGRVQALEKAGNWNLLVIYAAEWTRKQPGNADAWRSLSRGYIKLRQFGEALDAATKAIQLAPEDFLAWQNLGQLYVALQRPAEALPAFQRAAALNDRDVVSLLQVGMLNTRLGRLPDARIAFDKALAVSPEDVLALCGSAALAQKEGRVKDAEAITRQVTSLGDRCPDPSAGESVRVAVSGPAQNRPASPSRR